MTMVKITTLKKNYRYDWDVIITSNYDDGCNIDEHNDCEDKYNEARNFVLFFSDLSNLTFKFLIRKESTAVTQR